MLKHCLLSLILCTAVACKKNNNEKAADKPATTEPATKATDKADKPTDKPTDKPSDPPATPAGGVDQSNPVKVLEQVFAAAAAGKPDGLAGLCDPAGSGDGDVKRICASKPDDPKWKEFVEYFAKGKVEGAPRVTGDAAEIDFMFGPDGSKKETMKLKQIGGKWYLASF